jgi:hypothetical protein
VTWAINELVDAPPDETPQRFDIEAPLALLREKEERVECRRDARGSPLRDTRAPAQRH